MSHRDHSSTVAIADAGRTITVGDGFPVHFIAEIGLNHNGSVDLAKDLILAAVKSGATFVKFQKRSPKDLATASFLDSEFRKSPHLGTTQRQIRDMLEIDADGYQELQRFAKSLGAVFFASPFDLASLEFLLGVGTGLIKIASHSATNGPLLREINRQGLPTILSLGGTTLEEKDAAVAALRDVPLILMHCVSEYPTPDNRMGLDSIDFLRSRYGVPTGFSSHEAGVDFSTAAAVLGAALIERHVTLGKSMAGPDHAISLLPEELAELVRGVRRIERGRGVANGISTDEWAARRAYHVSVCTTKRIGEGEEIAASALVCKQPLGDEGEYFTGWELEDLVGKVALAEIEADTPIRRTWVE